MDCKNIEGILIDYIEDFLDSDMKEFADSHIDVCSECSRKVEEYRNIKNAFKSETLPKVSQRVIETLRTEAQKQNNDRKNFWKRWFYSPVLIPALSTAIALMVWIDYRDEQKKISEDPPFYPGEVLAKKLPQGKTANESYISRRELDKSDDNLISGSKVDSTDRADIGLADKNVSKNAKAQSNVVEENTGSEHDDIAEKELDTEGKSALKQPMQNRNLIKTDQYRYSDKEMFKDQQNVSADFDYKRDADKKVVHDKQDTKFERDSGTIDTYRTAAVAKPESTSEFNAEKDFKEIDEKRLKKLESPQVVLDKKYLDELNYALRQQKPGGCESAIITNEKLLQNTPPPSYITREQIYLSLAECYEQQNKSAKAIENYHLLQQISPSQNSFAAKKIKELNFKIKSADNINTISEPSEK